MPSFQIAGTAMIKIIRWYFIAIVCSLYVVNGYDVQGQPLTNIAFESLTINDGLSQGMVNRIIQDRFGFMWFATKDGLDRYDGYHFKVYRHDPQDPTSIADSHVQSLLEDSKGRMWTGTASGNLELFDHASGRFEHIMLEKDSTSAVTIGEVHQLVEDKQGNIWALCEKRVYLLLMQKNADGKGNPWRVKKIDIPRPQPANKLFVSKAGVIYLYNIFDSVIYTWDKQQQWLPWKVVSDYFSNNKTKDAVRISGLLEDSISNRVYVVYNNGIIQIDNNKPKLILDRTMQLFPHSFLDKSGNIWFLDEKHLTVFNLSSGQSRFIGSGDENIQYHLTLIQSTYLDRSGMIWMGTGGYGIITLDPWTERFHHLDKNSIYNFKEGADGRMMVNNGCACYKTLDKNSGLYTDSIPFSNAKKIYENFNDFSIPTFTDSLHRRWFADNERLLCYNEVTKKAVSYPIPLKNISNNYGLSMALWGDAQNQVWLGGAEGLLCFNIATKTWKIYRNNPADKTTLSFNVVFTLCPDPAEPQRYLWVGTNGGGLNRLDMGTGKFKRYTTSEGLPNNVIYGLLHDDVNRLWMSTNKGISCFDPAKETFQNYEEKDGLQSNEFNHDAFMKGSDGTLYFGGLNGFNYFDPREIIPNAVIPQVAFTDFRIRNLSITPKQSDAVLSSPIYMTKSVELPYSDNMFSFEFAALDFTAPQRNQYRYKMEGFDKDWINSGNLNTVAYTNLDPGTYTFKVKGSNKNGIWNEAGTSIQITILPPWYMTWWFRILGAATVFAIAYAFYKYRLNKAVELMAVRNRIASDLHDEIGSNLSNISIFSNVAQQEKQGSVQVSHMLDRISENAQASMEAMNDIVWMIKAGNDRFENIMVRMRTHASEVIEVIGYQLELKFDEGLNNIKLNMNDRKNFYLIFKEAVNNIAKYANGNEVQIEVKLKNRDIELIIRDDGAGFDPKLVSHGNGLVNMQTRAKLLNGKLTVSSTPGHGTIIELSFPV